MRTTKAAFVGFGEVNSPRELIASKCRRAAAELRELGLELVTTDPVTDDAAGADVARAVAELRGRDVDVVVACVAGWIPSHAVVRVLAELGDKPVVLWGLSGHYEQGRLVTTADQAGTSALRAILAELGYALRFVYNTPDGPSRAPRVVAAARAASARQDLRRARIGMMGYRDMNLYGTMFDGVSLKRDLGVEIEFFEMLEITRIMQTLGRAEVDAVVKDMQERWRFSKPAAPATLTSGASWYLAIERKVRERGYQAVSLIDVDGMKKLAGLPPAMVFMLLSDRTGVSTIPENDSLGAVTQLIVRLLTGQIGAYLEFYEFMEDRVLLGVPDFVPAEVVKGPVTVLPAAFGSFSEGLLNVSSLKTGRVTLSRLFPDRGGFGLHVATGEAVGPRSWEEAGWTRPAPQLPSLEVILDRPVEEFAQNVMAQHYILSYGDATDLLGELCALSGIRLLR